MQPFSRATSDDSDDDDTTFFLPRLVRFLAGFSSSVCILHVILPSPAADCSNALQACLVRASAIFLSAIVCGIGSYKRRRIRCLIALGAATLPSWRGRGLLLALACSLVVPRNALVVERNVRRGEAFVRCRFQALDAAALAGRAKLRALAAEANRRILPQVTHGDEEEMLFWRTFAKTPLVFVKLYSFQRIKFGRYGVIR